MLSFFLDIINVLCDFTLSNVCLSLFSGQELSEIGIKIFEPAIFVPPLEFQIILFAQHFTPNLIHCKSSERNLNAESWSRGRNSREAT